MLKTTTLAFAAAIMTSTVDARNLKSDDRDLDLPIDQQRLGEIDKKDY